MSPKVSVIIPCYNAEKTIGRTLDSLERQTYKDLCVVIVNDGSKDDTKSVIEKYMEHHPEMDIRLSSTKNGGVSKARNIALGLCDTEYIAFLDADDMYHPEFLGIHIKLMEAKGVDISMARYCWNEFTESEIKRKVSDVMPVDLLDMYFHKRVNKLNFGGCVYKHSIITENRLRFSVGIKYGEDSEFFCKYLYHCESAAFVDAELYCYIEESDSAMHKVDYAKTQNIEMFRRVKSYWGNKVPKSCNYIIARAIWSCLKDFASGDGEYYDKFRAEYDVTTAMKVLVEEEKEKAVKITAVMYLVSPCGFKNTIRILTKV